MLKKNLLFVIICLFIGAGFTQLSAQSDNRAISFWDDVTWFIDVYCGDEWTDHVEGYGSVHFVVKFKDGDPIWQRANSKMTATSSSGETFKYIERGFVPLYSLVYPVVWEERLNYQLIGDEGSHYIGYLIVRVTHEGGDIYNVEFFPIRNKCL